MAYQVTQAIAVLATLHKTVSICSLYILTQHPLNKWRTKQLPKSFILMGDFNSHNKQKGPDPCKKKKINSNNLYLHSQKSQTHPEVHFLL